MFKPLFALAALLGLAACSTLTAPTAPTLSTSCSAPPFGNRELFLRGGFNNWAATDNERFAWVCDRYELLAALSGEHPFKLADEDWSADADFGAGTDRRLQPNQPKTLVAKGPAIEAAFAGQQRFTVRVAGGSPQLTLQTMAAGTQDIETWRRQHASIAASVDDPVALGLRFDSRDPSHKTPFGAITAGTEARLAITAPPGVQRATLVIDKRRLEGNQELLEYVEVARVPMVFSDGRWRATHRFAEPAVYRYWFEIEVNGKRFAYQNNRDAIYWTREKGSGGVGTVEPLPEQLKRIRRFRQTVYAADYVVPTYAPDLVYYYVFPDRFRDGDSRNNPVLAITEGTSGAAS